VWKNLPFLLSDKYPVIAQYKHCAVGWKLKSRKSVCIYINNSLELIPKAGDNNRSGRNQPEISAAGGQKTKK
jgi:hypothetical protein